MAANIADKFTEATNGTRPDNAALTAQKSIGAASITVDSTAGWGTATAVHFVIYQIDASGARVANTQTEWKGIVSSSTSITSLTLKAGADQVYPVGSKVIATPTAAAWDDLVEGILDFANQDGTLITSAVRAALGLTSGETSGWETLGYAPNTITALGNRSYTVVVNSVDLTPTTSVGMRLKLPRTVTAPTYMGGAFNGSSHYFTKVTPTGTLSTVTNNFTLMAHVELTAYGTQGYIAGRSDAASNNGFGFYVNTNGTISVIVFNTLQANNRYITTYQSLPINKKVHVAASWTSGTVVIYFDGVSVPVGPATTNGTAPTTAGTGGDFSIGRMGALGVYWTGYISSVGVFDAVLPAATILQHMNQKLAGSETNCIGAWALNNNGTDDNSAGNTVTATGGVGYTARTPYTNSVTGTSVTAGTTNYGIIMAQTFSTNTTYTIQIPEGETLPTTGGIGTVSYSTQSVPYGFPKDKGKWDVEFILNTTILTASNATFAAMTGLSFIVPVGAWDVGWIGSTAVTAVVGLYFTLSDTSQTGLAATASDKRLQAYLLGTSGAASNSGDVNLVSARDLSAAATFTMYSLGATTTGNLNGTTATTKFFARNAYL